MVIGNGMIARRFSNFVGDDNVVIFASGVSNSQEKNPEQFIRELSLIQSTILSNSQRILVYFSTCSIHGSKTPYTKHKEKIERIIREKCKNYLILRLPLVVGPNQNKNQLLGYLIDKLKSQSDITVYRKANRYFLDSEDLPAIVQMILKNGIMNNTLDVAFDNSIEIDDLIDTIENKMAAKFKNRKYVNVESKYQVDNSSFLKLVSNQKGYSFTTSIESMLNKYF